MCTPRYLIWRVGVMAVFRTRRGGREERLVCLSSLVRGRQDRSSDLSDQKVSPMCSPFCRCSSVRFFCVCPGCGTRHLYHAYIVDVRGVGCVKGLVVFFQHGVAVYKEEDG